MSKIYGVIAEFKDQAPMIMESELPNEEAAHQKMVDLYRSKKCIRVAIFKAVYAGGNKSLLPDENNA